MNQATIYRTRSSDPFCRIPNETLQDKNLSFKAKGILAYLLSKPEDWIPQVNDLEKSSSDGEAAIRSALMELRKCGYAQLQKVMHKGQVKKWILVVSDAPKFPKSTKSVIQGESLNQPPPEAEPHSDFPHLDFPHLEIPHLENRPLSNTDTTNTELTKTEKKTRFSKPSVEEVKIFCVSIGLPESDGEGFWLSKEGTGWDKVKDWKATVRCWKHNGWMPSQKRNGFSKPPTVRAINEAREIIKPRILNPDLTEKIT